MKKIFILALICCALVYVAPEKSNNILSKISFGTLGKSQEEYREELKYKKTELAAYEKAIVDITADMERIVENAPTCPTTGQKAITTFTTDARDELRSKCENLEKEIYAIEQKLAKQ